jgi:hypothetical protein
LHQQICNDLGLSESDSSEIATKNCEIIVKQQAIAFAEWIKKEGWQPGDYVQNADGYHWMKDYPGGYQIETSESLYSLYLTQQK